MKLIKKTKWGDETIHRIQIGSIVQSLCAVIKEMIENELQTLYVFKRNNHIGYWTLTEEFMKEGKYSEIKHEKIENVE